MTTLTIYSSDKTYYATCSFGTSSYGSPLDSLDAFLKELKSGVVLSKTQKVSKSGKELDKPACWLPLNCGNVLLNDDFTPFVGKKLTKINRTTFISQ